MYFFFSYEYLVGAIDAQAELSARNVSGLVMANPDMWRFEQLRLSELLERRPLTPAPQLRRIVDARGETVAENRADLPPAPVVARSRPIYDAGAVAGHVQIVQSLRDLLARSALLEAGSLIIAASLLLYIHRFPVRTAVHAQRALEESERRYRTLYQAMSEGLAVFELPGPGRSDPGPLLLDSNPAWKALCRVRADAGGRGGTGALTEAIRDLLPQIAQGAALGAHFSREAAVADPERFFSLAILYPAPGVFAILLSDRTEIVKAQEERERMQQNLLQTQKLESLGLLAGGVAHDFNNLLVGILGNIDLALFKSLPSSAAGPHLQKAETAARRAAELTNQLLAYSGRGRFVVGPTDISRLVEEMGHLLDAVVARSAVVHYELAPVLPPIEADATQLRQLVMNLITNAADALDGRQGAIRVRTGAAGLDAARLSALLGGQSLAAGTYVWIEVADSGCGMDGATQARIFDPFFTTKERGRGLGLAAALGIVRGHRGALEVRSAPGAGTVFRVFFPALAAAQEPGHDPQRPAEEGAKPPPAGAVLVVDDEESVRAVAKEMLASRGFDVLTAADGVEGVEVFRAHAAGIAAVVLDMTMPRMGGAEAFRRIRALAPQVPVILCSGYSEHDALGGASGREAVGFVQKPYRAQAFLDTVRELIARRPQGGEAGTAPGPPLSPPEVPEAPAA